MEALKNVVFNTPDDEEFKAFIIENITENLNHARHVETEIHTFTGIYMAVVAGVLAFDFSGRHGVAFGVLVHMILLVGGFLAVLLLNRWYTAFDTFMASAECLSYLKEKLLMGEMDTKGAVTFWRAFTARYEKAIKNGEATRKKGNKAIAFEAVLGEEKYKEYKSSDRLFAFNIPKRGQARTREYVFGFHIIILTSVAVIIFRDLYGLVDFMF